MCLDILASMSNAYRPCVLFFGLRFGVGVIAIEFFLTFLVIVSGDLSQIAIETLFTCLFVCSNSSEFSFTEVSE